MAPLHLQVHLNRTARHGAEVPVLTSTAVSVQCCKGMNSLCWWGVTNCSSPPHFTGLCCSQPAKGARISAAQGCAGTLGGSALAWDIHNTYGVWRRLPKLTLAWVFNWVYCWRGQRRGCFWW